MTFIAHRDPKGYFRFGASQSAAAASLLAAPALTRESARSLVLIEDGAVFLRNRPRHCASRAGSRGRGPCSDLARGAASAARRRLPRHRRDPSSRRGPLECLPDSAGRDSRAAHRGGPDGRGTPHLTMQLTVAPAPAVARAAARLGRVDVLVAVLTGLLSAACICHALSRPHGHRRRVQVRVRRPHPRHSARPRLSAVHADLPRLLVSAVGRDRLPDQCDVGALWRDRGRLRVSHRSASRCAPRARDLNGPRARAGRRLLVEGALREGLHAERRAQCRRVCSCCSCGATRAGAATCSGPLGLSRSVWGSSDDSRDRAGARPLRRGHGATDGAAPDDDRGRDRHGDARLLAVPAHHHPDAAACGLCRSARGHALATLVGDDRAPVRHGNRRLSARPADVVPGTAHQWTRPHGVRRAGARAPGRRPGRARGP